MVAPLTIDIPYGPYIMHRFDHYQATGGTIPPDGKPWILITPVDGFRGGGKKSVQASGRSFFRFIKYFIDDRVVNGLATPFDIFVADGGVKLPATEVLAGDPIFEGNHAFSVYAPENCYQYARCFQTIKTIIQDNPTRFPNLNPAAGGYAGFSAGGTASLVCAYTEPAIIHSRGFNAPYTTQWIRNESSRPAFLVNWSGGSDYRVGAYVANNNANIFGTLDGDQHTSSIPAELLDAISGITLVNSKSCPTINMYDDPAAEPRPLTQAHNQTQGIELQAALTAAGVYSEFHTKAITGPFVSQLDENIDIPKIYDFIVGSNVLNLE